MEDAAAAAAAAAKKRRQLPAWIRDQLEKIKAKEAQEASKEASDKGEDADNTNDDEEEDDEREGRGGEINGDSTRGKLDVARDRLRSLSHTPSDNAEDEDEKVRTLHR